MEFIIQHNLMNAEQLALTREAIKSYPHKFVGLIPFSREITSDEPLVGQDFIPYGSTLLTTLVSEMGWKGLHFDLSKFNYEESLKNRDDMLNAELIMSAKEAHKFMWEDYLTDGGQLWFIRPSEDLKQFSGQVIEAKECAEWLQDAMSLPIESGSYAIDPNMKVVIARPKNIQAEWRWFVVDGEVIDGSMYRANGQLIKKHEIDQKVIYEAQTFADKWLPDSCCCMDLALVDNGVKVIEFNCINSSGFYNHNVNEIFKSLWEFHNK